MNDRTKEREEEDEKVIQASPENKDRKRTGKEGEEGDKPDPRADAYGTRHLMEEEMKKNYAKEEAAGGSRPDQGLPGAGAGGGPRPDQGLPETDDGNDLEKPDGQPPLGGSRGSPGRRR
jgi:hypothetical protein